MGPMLPNQGCFRPTRAVARLAFGAATPHFAPMPEPIRVARSPDGVVAYAIPLPPETLPPVAPRDLEFAWDRARDAAASERWGPPRRLVFRRDDGSPQEMLLADVDAACWAEAVDGMHDLGTLGGLSLCLRLLALVEVMSRARWLAGLYAMTPQGIELHPTLLRAAAAMPLDAAARFDETGLKRLLSRSIPSGASA
ncbi:hypothetical protein GCM10011320_00510 [Neoroseomonas lacus]|uniref:Uncharacterized protein n=2 Tax=Neoroseomonas lacus TaxID=287609 RepID=A0A917K1W6_9PROT|nr:hypothetical protein GCM10011320_00510 [Neoroseomonas lacus]